MMVNRSDRRKAEFKSIAADLVSRDREVRKSAFGQFNLGQKITAELEKAYKRGVSESASEVNADDSVALSFVDIPNRYKASFGHIGEWQKHDPCFISFNNKACFLFDKEVKDTLSESLKKRRNTDFISSKGIEALAKLNLLSMEIRREFCYFKLTDLGVQVYAQALTDKLVLPIEEP